MAHPILVTDLAHYARLIFRDKWRQGWFVVLKVIPQFDSFVDESSDQKQEHVLCVAAFFARELRWEFLQELWMNALRTEEVAYFENNECQAVQGAFRHLLKKYGSLDKARIAANKLKGELLRVLLEFPRFWTAFCICVDVPEYKQVLAEYPVVARRFFWDRPVVSGYEQLMYEVAHTTRRKTKAASAVAFVIDISSDSPRIMDGFRTLQENHPSFAKTAKSVLPLDDKETPPLQMADLLASFAREEFLKWKTQGKTEQFSLPGPLGDRFERVGIWDRTHMLRIIARTTKSSRYVKGTLAQRIKTERKLSKSERKKLQRSIAARIRRKNNEEAK